MDIQTETEMKGGSDFLRQAMMSPRIKMGRYTHPHELVDAVVGPALGARADTCIKCVCVHAVCLYA